MSALPTPQDIRDQTSPTQFGTPTDSGPAAAMGRGVQVESQLNDLGSLLESVEPDFLEPAQESQNLCPADAPADDLDNRLAQVRLGMASSLFTALRCKDPATAAHCVRVALGCSAWAAALDMPADQRDTLEVAALLHDVGKIGVPDCVLLKPAELTAEERAVMDRHVQFGLDILKTCCASTDVLDIVRQSSVWFDGSQLRVDRHGADLLLGARMLAIVNAFDSMITAQVYRPASSRDQAVTELCEFAGTQFDPQLVFNFAQLQASDQQKLHHTVARHWLQELDADRADGIWQRQPGRSTSVSPTPSWLYQQKLLENMYDGVIFLDTNLHVMLWNRGAERLTGINGASMMQRPFLPSVVAMRDEHGAAIGDENCPVAHAVRSGVQSLRRLIVRSRDERALAVDAHLIPVVGHDGIMQGISLLMHDASGEASLEERCHSLYEQAIRDPLTQLANRAEFDRVRTLFVEAHLERHLPCSLIICDIDHFKQVNDTWGHQAGDEAIRAIAQLLKNSCRPGDLAARYGGEEFVILCADCNSDTAAARAEHLRKAFCSLPQPAIGGRSCAASFGVTEIQAGDNAETMLNRADRALLMAKHGGRNRVVHLGGGMKEPPSEVRRGWRFWQKNRAGPLTHKWLVTSVPLDITVEKLRGFVADHNARVIGVDGARVELLIQSNPQGASRRRTDRAVPLVMELEFSQEGQSVKNEAQAPAQNSPQKNWPMQTRIQVIVRPSKGRDRRLETALAQARLMVSSLRSYLMANESTPPDLSMCQTPATLQVPWLTPA